MLPFARTSLSVRRKSVAIFIMLALVAALCSELAWSSSGLPRIDVKTLGLLAKQRPVIVLFRHAERCDRSDNPCLSDKTGITLSGAQAARALGKTFSANIKEYDLYSSSAVRTIQSASWFSGGKKLTVDKNMLSCGRDIYRAMNNIISRSPDKNVVIFTHNHCLSRIAEDKRGANVDPDYLDGLVMHADKGRLFLDGRLAAR
ncbi:lipopolysaccharide core heptose(II)-phosphate phosphatase [Intestinirhabdus alba]|uniref:Lipopolysaccharide core heptose(II)-phosphate phosphatase n=1 Tax=Intestinirhabdus alba TaxID=2899544 RepID=A0A6L6IIL8_9ENTR|nr:lipopolysaccharide core heptose(II)-phosphate phosphatase [Intestinirhabdus alba]